MVRFLYLAIVIKIKVSFYLNIMKIECLSEKIFSDRHCVVRLYSGFNYFDTRQQTADSTNSTESILLPLGGLQNRSL